MNLPNIITLVRIIFVPLLIIFFEYRYIALIMFTGAIVTDCLDGAIARIKKMKTELGSMLDPLADKFLLLTAFILLSSSGSIPPWYTIIIVTRDVAILVGWLVIYLITNITTVVPTVLGKLTNFLQSVSIIIYIGQFSFIPKDFTTKLSYLMLSVTIVSGLEYMLRGLNTVEAIQKKSRSNQDNSL